MCLLFVYPYPLGARTDLYNKESKSPYNLARDPDVGKLLQVRTGQAQCNFCHKFSHLSVSGCLDLRDDEYVGDEDSD